jgi:hypothetical protein
MNHAMPVRHNPGRVMCEARGAANSARLVVSAVAHAGASAPARFD